MTEMTRENFRFYTESLARQLGCVRGELWAVSHAPDSWPNGADLTCGRAVLHARVSHGRLAVEGKAPDGYSLRRSWQRTFALGADGWPCWDALRVAREVDRHIVSAGYIDDLLVVTARKDEADRVDLARAELLARAAALFGVQPPEADRHMRQRAEAWKLNLGRFVTGSGYVEASTRGDGTDHLDINLSGIPAEVALGMLEVLARHVEHGALCCWRYGPGHHPDFSVVGCLRERSERGEHASAQRVRALLMERGAQPGDITAALVKARAAGCEDVMRGGDLVAVVEYDPDRLEYTVQLARPRATA
jgi:hypothetical protein